jgi:glutaconate CoA-transferase subunit B
VAENTGFYMDISRAVEAEPPGDDVLKTLVNRVDPMRLMT